MPRPKITPCLWFDNNAEEAVQFYVSLFRDSRILRTVPGPAGVPMVIEFELAEVPMLALNGGPHYRFNEAISLSVDCADQEEIDQLWEKLCEGGSPGPCGWLKDRYGLSWQLVPRCLPEMLSDPDTARTKRVMDTVLQMGKLEIAPLRRAYEQN